MCPPPSLNGQESWSINFGLVSFADCNLMEIVSVLMLHLYQIKL